MKLQPPTPEDIAYQLKHASDDRRVVLFVSTALMNAVATVAVVLRLVARRINRTKLLADDYTIFAALVGLRRSSEKACLGAHVVPHRCYHLVFSRTGWSVRFMLPCAVSVL